jgi:type I restriction enzyme S subunit
MSIAATVGVPIITGIPACIHDGFVALERLRGVDQMYLLYALKSLEDELRSAGQTGSQANVNTEIVNGLLLDLPPEPEQKRIAEALRDADGQISALKSLVMKKRAIRQGMMKQLLNGETRLPGFGGPSESHRLREIGGTYGGLTGKTRDDFGRGEGAYITFLELINNIRVRGRHLECVRVGKSERQNRVLRGDLLFNGSSETPEEVALSAVVDFDTSATTYLNSFCFGYRIKRRDLADPTFVAYYFRSSHGRSLVASLAQGATRYNIAKTKFLDLALTLPSLDDQKAIVAALNDCEDEIELLNTRLAKAEDLKQGMMQELLTGRTRLLVGEPVG